MTRKIALQNKYLRAVPNILRTIDTYLMFNVFKLRARVSLANIVLKYYLMRFFLKTLNYENAFLRSRYYKLPRQEELIWNKKFDALIILDACRYDIFSNVIHDYLDGTLIPVISPASVTIDWLRRVWSGRRWPDIVYVSASPMINKRGLLRDFDARKRFLYIEEVWDWGWDEDFITVPPNNVNLAVKLAMTKMKLRGLKYIEDYKLVIHYVQPHAPYVSFKNITSMISKTESLKKEIEDVTLRKLGRFCGKLSIDHVLLASLMQVYKNKKTVDYMLKKAYEYNLRWVIKYVAELTTRLNGRIIITADHGELLGEYGLYFHMDLPLPILRMVPWFVVK